MTARPSALNPASDEHPDYTRLPTPVDLAQTVETSNVDPLPFEPKSIWATEELEAMARTNALGGL